MTPLSQTEGLTYVAEHVADNIDERSEEMPFHAQSVSLRLTDCLLRTFDCQMACHERSSRFAEGKRELSRMVEAAGVESKVGKFSNLLMARDF